MMRNASIRRCLCLAVAAFLFSSAAYGQGVQLYPDVEQLAAQPDAHVTRNADGTVATVQLRRNGVVIDATRQDDRVRVLGSDRSGHGAVLCAWSIYIEVKTGLNMCFPGKHPELTKRLDSTIDAINGFIVSNSLVPTSREALASAIAAREAAKREKTSGQLSQMCNSSFLGRAISRMAQTSENDWQTSVNKLLAVPRPPVMNPCL